MNAARCYARSMDEAATEDLMARLVDVDAELKEAQGRAQRLAAERRAIILELHSRKVPDVRMAELLGVNRSAIQSIRAGRAGLKRSGRR